MNLKVPTARHFTCHMRLWGCIAPPHSQFLRPSRRHSLAKCHAVSASQPSAAARIEALKQQYQGLLASAKPKPASSNTAGRKSTQSSKTAKQKGNSPGSNVSSRVGGSAEKPSSSDSPVAATQHSRRNRSDASAGRKPAHGKAVTSNSSSSSGSSKSRSSSSNSSTKASRDLQDKKKPSNSGIGEQASQETAAAAPAQQVSLSGKGFGISAAAPPSSTSTFKPSSSSSSSPTSSSSSRSSKTTKLFRFGVEAAAIQKVIQQNGWEERVEQVEQLSQADVLVAIKCTPGGRHQNLQQGEKAAANANIPFIVIGRRLSKEQFYKALSPHLGLQTPDEREAAAAEAKQAGHDQALADQWFTTASLIKWGSAVPAAATNATAALQQRKQQQTVAAQVQVHRKQQQAAASGSVGRSSSSSRGATR